MLREKSGKETEEKARNLHNSENIAYLRGNKSISMILMTTCNPVLPLYKPFRTELKSIKIKLLLQYCIVN